MKIGFTGIDIPEGKSKYNDPILQALAEKDKPDTEHIIAGTEDAYKKDDLPF